MTRLLQSETALRQELVALELDYAPIRLLSTQSNQKNLVIPKDNTSLGWIPHTDSYQLIQLDTPPKKDVVFRHVAYEPETSLTNLPLTIFNFIHFADHIGATDDCLLTMIIIYLKQYRNTVLEHLDTKK